MLYCRVVVVFLLNSEEKKKREKTLRDQIASEERMIDTASVEAKKSVCR
jgi:hypothetical protein